jgi:hypothetical protein
MIEERQPDGTFTERKISKTDLDRKLAPLRRPLTPVHMEASNRAERRAAGIRRRPVRLG